MGTEGGREGGREFVLYFIIVFKEAHLFWREELSLTNIQTIFTIQELKNRAITIPYLKRERDRERQRERGGERRGKRGRRRKEDKRRMKRPVIQKVIYCNIISHIYKSHRMYCTVYHQ